MREILLNSIIVFSGLSLFASCGNNQGKTNDTDHSVQEFIVLQDSLIFNESLNATDTSLFNITSVPAKIINKNNLVVREWNTDVRTNVRMLDHVTTYNADGQKIEEIEYNSEGQKWRERYEYVTNGKKVRELVYDGHNRLVQVKKYQYNEYGKKTITYTYNAQGKLIAIKNYEYLMQE